MTELTDDFIREAWGWLPHGEHCTELYIEYQYAKVTDEHRMAALAGARWIIEWLGETCKIHPDMDITARKYCDECWPEAQRFFNFP